jgi:Peptidase MA superfamily
MYRLVLFALLFAQAPQLQFDGPPEMAAVRARLESIDPHRFADITQLTGVTDSGPAIHVVLAPENSELAHEVATWVAGFAVGESALVVIFPSRSPSYPDDTLEDVLRHEVTHVLIWRASGGRPIPRWFNEGLAMAAERDRQFEDQTQFLYQLATGSHANLDELNRLFSGGQNDQTRAYALAGALVHNVVQRYGPAVSGDILRRVSGGARFDDAFQAATGRTPDAMEADFWQSQRIWTTWLPIIASSTTLWLAITMLALLAIYMRHRKNRAIEEKWAEEDDKDDIEL